jgi:hypothetical protein
MCTWTWLVINESYWHQTDLRVSRYCSKSFSWSGSHDHTENYWHGRVWSDLLSTTTESVWQEVYWSWQYIPQFMANTMWLFSHHFFSILSGFPHPNISMWWTVFSSAWGLYWTENTQKNMKLIFSTGVIQLHLQYNTLPKQMVSSLSKITQKKNYPAKGFHQKKICRSLKMLNSTSKCLKIKLKSY